VSRAGREDGSPAADEAHSPLWSLAIFALSLWIIHGLVIYGDTVEDALP
jgi:hypothetical protein